MPAAVRLDVLLAARGLAPSRERARALVLAGRVQVDGRRVEKAGTRVPEAASLCVEDDPVPFVSRGGIKLAAALDRFGIDPAGLSVLDIGASTGGFTDCLLQRGASRVVALDVGHGQLDWRLRNDPRVVVVERFNARNLDSGAWDRATGGRVDISGLGLAVADVSFISLRLVLPPLAALPAPDRSLVLVKPQFEVGRRQVGKGGIVRDPTLHAMAIESVAAAAAAAGWRTAGLAPSVLPGTGGNREFWLDLVRCGTGAAGGDIGLSAAEMARAVEPA